MTKKILIADDHEIVRNGLKLVFTDEFSDVEFGEAQDSAEVLHKIKEKKWDIIILDINMPGRSGLDVLCEMKSENVKIPVLVLSMHTEEQLAVRVLKAGAWGYLAKEARNTELIQAVRQILSGKKFISSSLAELLAEQLKNPTHDEPHKLLSDREYQTLLMIAQGKSTTEIAEELSISVPTVNTFRSRILEKMKMKNNAELVAYVIRQNLI